MYMKLFVDHIEYVIDGITVIMYDTIPIFLEAMSDEQ